jgi:hypothetical protein
MVGNKCLRTGVPLFGGLSDEKRGIATGQVFPRNQFLGPLID